MLNGRSISKPAGMKHEGKSPVSPSGRVGSAYTETLCNVATRHKTPMFLSERAVQNEQDIVEAIEVRNPL